MFQEFTLRLISPRDLLLLLLLQLTLHRRDRFRRARSSSLDPGRRQDEAAEDHGHCNQSDGGDPRDLNRRALHRRPHVRLQRKIDTS